MTTGAPNLRPPPVTYVRHSELKVEESGRAELKAHRCLSALDLSGLSYGPGRDGGVYEKWRYRRRVLSDSLCGMLNTGRGGTLYLGVTDEGALEGLHMTNYQKDHFLLALHDLFSSYSPPVPSHMCEVHFVPLVEADGNDALMDPTALLPEDWASRSENWASRSENCRDLPHELRESRYCWCDCDAFAAMEKGMLDRFYIVELRIPPWNPQDWRNRGMVIQEAPQIPPVFQNEKDLCFLRGEGGTTMTRLRDVEHIIREKVALSEAKKVEDSGVADSDDLENIFATEDQEKDCGDSDSDASVKSFAEEEYLNDCHIS